MKNKKVFYCLIGLILILGITVGYFKIFMPAKINWENQANGVWVMTDKVCMERKGKSLPWMCKSNCFEQSNAKIWEYCQREGNVKRTDTGTEVLCFSDGCMPETSDGICKIVCPI
jgi:hypothetical protein